METDREREKEIEEKKKGGKEREGGREGDGSPCHPSMTLLFHREFPRFSLSVSLSRESLWEGGKEPRGR